MRVFLPVDVCGCQSAHLLSSSSSTSPSSLYGFPLPPHHLPLCSGFPHPPRKVSSCSPPSRNPPIAPHSGLEGRHRGPQCPLWNHRGPRLSASHQIFLPPILPATVTPSHTRTGVPKHPNDTAPRPRPVGVEGGESR